MSRGYDVTSQYLGRGLHSLISTNLACTHPQVLEGYMLQGIQGKHLAEKVLQCFKEAVYETTMKVVRSLMLTKPK